MVNVCSAKTCLRAYYPRDFSTFHSYPCVLMYRRQRFVHNWHVSRTWWVEFWCSGGMTSVIDLTQTMTGIFTGRKPLHQSTIRLSRVLFLCYRFKDALVHISDYIPFLLVALWSLLKPLCASVNIDSGCLSVLIDNQPIQTDLAVNHFAALLLSSLRDQRKIEANADTVQLHT